MALTTLRFPCKGTDLEKLANLIYFKKDRHDFHPDLIEIIYFLRNHSDAIKEMGYEDPVEMSMFKLGLDFSLILDTLTDIEWEFLQSITPEETPVS